MQVVGKTTRAFSEMRMNRDPLPTAEIFTSPSRRVAFWKNPSAPGGLRCSDGRNLLRAPLAGSFFQPARVRE